MSTLIKLTKTGKVNRELRRRLPAGLGSSVVGIFINPAEQPQGCRRWSAATPWPSCWNRCSPSSCSLDSSRVRRPQSIPRPDDGLRRRIVDTGLGNHRHRAPARRPHCHRDGQPEVDARVFGGILGALVLLGVIKQALRRHLRDLL